MKPNTYFSIIDELEEENYQYAREGLKDAFQNYYNEVEVVKFNKKMSIASISIVALMIIGISLLFMF